MVPVITGNWCPSKCYWLIDWLIYWLSICCDQHHQNFLQDVSTLLLLLQWFLYISIQVSLGFYWRVVFSRVCHSSEVFFNTVYPSLEWSSSWSFNTWLPLIILLFFLHSTSFGPVLFILSFLVYFLLFVLICQYQYKSSASVSSFYTDTTLLYKSAFTFMFVLCISPAYWMPVNLLVSVYQIAVCWLQIGVNISYTSRLLFNSRVIRPNYRRNFRRRTGFYTESTE